MGSRTFFSNNSSEQFWKQKTIPNLCLGQFWKWNGSMLSNMAGLWNSNNDWALNERGEMVYIENTLTNKVLIIKNNEIYEENMDQNADGQLWQKEMIYYDSGYFLLRDPNSQKVLTATLDQSFKLKSKYHFLLQKLCKSFAVVAQKLCSN